MSEFPPLLCALCGRVLGNNPKQISIEERSYLICHDAAGCRLTLLRKLKVCGLCGFNSYSSA